MSTTVRPVEDDPGFGERLAEELNAFNYAAAGRDDGRDLDFAVEDDGQMVAGLSGYTWAGIAEVKVLWVREDQRGRDLGSALMAAAIGEARARGCKLMFLSTHSFQAQGFYEKLGFETIATIPDKPLGHAEHWMRLKL
jgi:ribosomal protein S18 acetylase RimI-like enzyme